MSLTFNILVCSASPVRDAFDVHPVCRAWWKIVLALHGKPARNCSDTARALAVAADGFRFYAQLYSFLGVGFLVLAPFLFLAGDALPLASARYWGLSSILGGLYLCAVSSLGFHGASTMRRGHARSPYPLIAFMVAVIGFLSALTAVLCLALAGGNDIAALCGGALVSVFGIASYLIEIIYLATEGRMLVERISEGRYHS